MMNCFLLHKNLAWSWFWLPFHRKQTHFEWAEFEYRSPSFSHCEFPFQRWVRIGSVALSDWSRFHWPWLICFISCEWAWEWPAASGVIGILVPADFVVVLFFFSSRLAQHVWISSPSLAWSSIQLILLLFGGFDLNLDLSLFSW